LGVAVIRSSGYVRVALLMLAENLFPPIPSEVVLIGQGGVGRALAVTEGILGQIYLVTAVAALVGNLGRRRAPLQEADDKASEDEETRSG
jgi:membrane protein DedA with SNARE-associated domain